MVELPLADFGTVREIFLLSMRTKSITENFFSVKSTFIVVFVIIQHIVNLDVRPYDRTTVQGPIFNMRGQLYCGHANATALSSSQCTGLRVGRPGF